MVRSTRANSQTGYPPDEIARCALVIRSSPDLPATMPATSGQPILVVEDNPLFQDLLRSAASRSSHNDSIIICGDGTEALSLIARPDFCIDLALIDLGLPDISGIKVIEAIRARLPDVPIMVVSVIQSEDMVIAAIRAGAKGYITKGQSEFSITQSIKDVMAGNYPISPSLARSLFRLVDARPNVTPNQFKLTEREAETLRLLSRGLAYSQVATEMNISLSTVQSHVRNLYRKLGVNSQAQAVAKAHQTGMVGNTNKLEESQ